MRLRPSRRAEAARPTTMRRQLAGVATATMALLLLAFLLPTGLLLRRVAEDDAITAATRRAQSIAVLLMLRPDAQPAGAGVTVFDPDDTVRGTPAQRTESVQLAVATGSAFAARSGDGVEVLAPLTTARGTQVVRVYVPPDELYAGVWRTWSLLAALGAALFVLGLFIADRLSRRLVRATGALAVTADRLAAGDMAARVAVEGPVELRRVGAELNRLAARIDELLVDQRREAAELTHRLRTPLTYLRLEAESVSDDAERARLAHGVREMAGAVDEVIFTVARTGREGAHPVCDLAAVVTERAEFWSALAEETGRAFSTVLPEQLVPVRLVAADAVTLVDVLLDNIFTHTPDGAAVQVHLSADPYGAVTLLVDDAGPGFPAELAAQPAATTPGSASGSTGLGLHIARRIAAAAGGQLVLERSTYGGGRVRVGFGPTS